MKLYKNRIGIGALHFGNLVSKEISYDIIRKAFSNGISFIDTSPLYGNTYSEKIVGSAIKNFPRNKMTIASKVGLKKKINNGQWGVEIMRLNKKNIIASVDRSLKNLNTDYLDLLQLHAFDKKTSIDETFECLERLITQGKILSVGISNYNPSEVRKVLKNEISKNISYCQIHYNIFERKAELELLPLLKKNKITPLINRALARGILSDKYKLGEKFPKNSRADLSLRIKKNITRDLLICLLEIQKLSKNLGLSTSQLALIWHLLKEKDSIVIMGLRNLNQLKECIGVIKSKKKLNIVKKIDEIITYCNYSQKIYKKPVSFLEK